MELLLEGVFRKYGYDFRDYNHASIHRRIQKAMMDERLNTPTALLHRILEDSVCMERFLHTVTIHVTGMFRDPEFYAAFRKQVAPHLRTYPFVRVWCPGCSTGEEVYSLAILLREEGIKKFLLYGTDLSEEAIDKARQGIMPLAHMRAQSENYLRSGGKSSLSDYYTASYDNAILVNSFKDNFVFAQHDLVSGASFNEFQVILCRNVLIYFNARLSARVHTLLYESLCPFGFLCLGDAESIRFTPLEDCYEYVDEKSRIYQKVK